MSSLREEADDAKRECLEIKKMAEERELLLKQEQTALRKVSINWNMSRVDSLVKTTIT